MMADMSDLENVTELNEFFPRLVINLQVSLPNDAFDHKEYFRRIGYTVHSDPNSYVLPYVVPKDHKLFTMLEKPRMTDLFDFHGVLDRARTRNVAMVSIPLVSPGTYHGVHYQNKITIVEPFTYELAEYLGLLDELKLSYGRVNISRDFRLPSKIDTLTSLRNFLS